ILERELFSKSNEFDNIADIYILLKQFDKAEKICSTNKLGKLYEAMNEMSKAEKAYSDKMELANFYERWYKKTNNEEYIKKAEQIWKEEKGIQSKMTLARLYERYYKQTKKMKNI
ncbi:MAG: hypothetical protein O7C56_00530, partial [Rickettsia endosymbiont of Ixodes persulcatus]|nr:hypothetical protein [Rickettsia endosymbiont of Ixodes persulcatus]